MPKETEVSMMDKLIQHLIKVLDNDSKFWCEVKVPGVGTADAVAVIGGKYFIFEGKAKLSYALLAQCVRWKNLCSCVNAVIPYASREDEETSLALEHFRSNGISVVMVGSHISYPVSADKNKNSYMGISEFLTDAHLYGGRFAKAGTAGGRRASKDNEEFVQIEDWVKSNPGESAYYVGREFKMKSTRILKLVREGKLNVELKDVGGIRYLYPKGAAQ